MRIRKAELCDLNRQMEIYAVSRKFMAEHGNPNQWGRTSWPPESVIRNDIKQRNSYVCEEDDRIIATFFFIEGEKVEQTYENVDTVQWFGNDHYGVVHRIATDHTIRGTGTFCLNWALKQSPHLRIDTHPDNTVMQGLLIKLGFKECGTIYVREDPDPRIAFERINERQE